MAHVTITQKKKIAFDLYLNTETDATEIADLVGINVKTLYNWRVKGKWDELKAASIVTPDQIVTNLYQKILTLSEDKQKDNSDTIVKLAAAIEKIKVRKLTISNYLNTLEDYGKFLAKHDPKVMRDNAPYMKAFIETLAQPNHK